LQRTSDKPMRRILALTLFIVLFAAATRVIAQQSFGSADIISQNASTPTSLLAGKTPATFTSLAGWTTVAKEDFEGTAEDCGGGCYDSQSGILVTSVMSHSNGTHSMQVNVTGDANDSRFGVVTASATEYYISGWRFDQGSPSQGADYYLSRLLQNFGSGPLQDCKFDPQDSFADYITLSADANLICEGPHQHLNFDSQGHRQSVLMPNQWAQYESWYRPSSCTGSKMNTDGFFHQYKNGTEVVKIDSTTVDKGHIGGCPSMNSGANMNMEFGGVMSYLMNSTTLSPSGTCFPLGSQPQQPRCQPFSACPVLQSNGHACWGSQPPFKVFQDDIIFLKR
jgi:hypothetical protein